MLLSASVRLGSERLGVVRTASTFEGGADFCCRSPNTLLITTMRALSTMRNPKTTAMPKSVAMTV